VSYPELVHRLSSVPLVGRSVEWVQENTDVSAEQVQGWVTEGLQVLLKNAASMGGSVALNVFGTLVGFFIMIFTLFFLRRDGRRIVERLIELVPVERQRRGKLLKYLGDVTRAVVYGSAATALVQGLMVGLGFAFFKLPSPVVFAVIATIAAFLPVGAAIVLIPAVIYLAATGHWGSAGGLAAWTALMWLVETILRPLLAAHQAQVSTLAIFIGAIG